ncbi:hypothetical protein PVAND_016248 [Polypedilum vanderplanki]|uniref:Uncharacterized protein n=1 Tax=Polypedilum vanderplanki TaxID=319348 RepID=A0A9J6BFM6_POLVA|nr:hypothetical protein PVAND_016248 [Polypedilum vanderplanki]
MKSIFMIFLLIVITIANPVPENNEEKQPSDNAKATTIDTFYGDGEGEEEYYGCEYYDAPDYEGNSEEMKSS